MLKKIKLIGEQKKVLFLPPTNPIQIKGVAGSGKTTVALYRAKHLLETQANIFKETKIVIFTYNKTLAAYIRAIKPYINGGYQKDSDELKPKTPDGLNVQIVNFDRWAFHFAGIPIDSERRWLRKNILPQIISNTKSSTSNILNKSFEFFDEEISWIKGKMFKTKNEYLEAARTGRGTADRVTRVDKEVIWDVLTKYNFELEKRRKIEFDDYALLAINKIESNPNFIPPYTHIIVDEAQDLTKAQMLTISKLVDKETNSISIIADAAQRIYKSGFVWSEVDINVRGGRTIAFKKNYRNTIEIAKAAKSLLENETDDEDFTEIEYSVREGKKPRIAYYSDFEEQLNYLEDQLNILKNNDNLYSTIVLHRSTNGVRRIKAFLDANGFVTELVKSSQPVNYGSDSVKICTMSSIKGLEFNNVIILDLNDNVIPYPPGFSEEDDEYHISTERRLLYTCMTRARNELFLFSSDKDNPSRYLKEIDSDLLDDISPKSNSTASSTYDDDLPF